MFLDVLFAKTLEKTVFVAGNTGEQRGSARIHTYVHTYIHTLQYITLHYIT